MKVLGHCPQEKQQFYILKFSFVMKMKQESYPGKQIYEDGNGKIKEV